MITIENYSPFPHLLFEKTGLRGEVFDVIVVGGTFEVVHGTPLAPANEQLPLVYADEYYDDPMTSSLAAEGNLVIAKKSADVHVVGRARSPRGRPTTDWLVSVRIGRIEKTVRVTGPRWWEHSEWGWRLTQPAPCTEVPLRYELAYGGTVIRKLPDGQEEKRVYPTNPIGCGYLAGEDPDPERRYAAPQIEEPDFPIQRITDEYRPVGFGPICRWWQPRSQKAGTYDDAWRNERFPAYPDDFDFAFYNAAHPDLIYDGFLTGDEAVALTGFFPEGQVDTYLPGFSVVAVLKDQADYAQSEELQLDTVTFDTNARTATLIWRKTVPRSWGMASIVVGAIPAGPSSKKSTTVRLAQLHR